MKKLIALCITLICIITSCSTESVDSDNNSSTIVGTWEMVDYDYSGTTVTEFQGQSSTTTFTGEAYDIDNKITFEENPNKFISEGSYNIKLTYTVSGQTTTQNIENLEALTTSTGAWEILDGELMTSSSINNETGKFKIEKLTESTLVLTAEQEEDLSQSGAKVITTTSLAVYLER